MTTTIRSILSKVKDPGSALTHFAAVLGTAAASVPLLTKALADGKGIPAIAALLVFVTSMFLLYSASTVYHSVRGSERVCRILRKLDHMMIYLLIAGSYTPVCLLILGRDTGIPLLAGVWGLAAAGMLLNAFWIRCPKGVSSAIYIAMGWFCVTALKEIVAALPPEGFFWLLLGGIIYTVGGVIYALKLSAFNARHLYFGSHEIFHLFVMAGSACHFVLMYRFAA